MKGFCIITENNCSEARSLELTRLYSLRRNSRNHYSLIFFAWEKKLCLLLHGLPPKEELDLPRLHCIGESVTQKAVASIQMPKAAGDHWMRPSHSTPQVIQKRTDGEFLLSPVVVTAAMAIC